MNSSNPSNTRSHALSCALTRSHAYLKNFVFKIYASIRRMLAHKQTTGPVCKHTSFAHSYLNSSNSSNTRSHVYLKNFVFKIYASIRRMLAHKQKQTTGPVCKHTFPVVRFCLCVSAWLFYFTLVADYLLCLLIEDMELVKVECKLNCIANLSCCTWVNSCCTRYSS